MEFSLVIKNENHFQEMELDITVLSKVKQVQKEVFHALSHVESESTILEEKEEEQRWGDGTGTGRAMGIEGVKVHDTHKSPCHYGTHHFIKC